MERKLSVSQSIWSKHEYFSPVETVGNQLPADTVSGPSSASHFVPPLLGNLHKNPAPSNIDQQERRDLVMTEQRLRAEQHIATGHAKLPHCFSDLAHRQGISYPSLV